MPNMSIYVSMETFMQITELAQKNGLTPSMQARKLIEEALKNMNKKPVKTTTTVTQTGTQQEAEAKEGVKGLKHVLRKKAESV